MTITIGGTTFNRVRYDHVADVLYLHVGDPAMAVDFDESSEGHALRFGRDGELVGLTIMGPRRALEDGQPVDVTRRVRDQAPLDLQTIPAAIGGCDGRG